jgi:hypothetical protein
MIDYEVVIEDAVVIVTHRKYSHVWRFPRTAAPHFIGTPTVIENQTADRGVSLLHDDAQSAAMGALINAQSRQSDAKIMEALTNAQSLRDEPTGAKILADLNKMYEVAKRELPLKCAWHHAADIAARALTPNPSIVAAWVFSIVASTSASRVKESPSTQSLSLRVRTISSN